MPIEDLILGLLQQNIVYIVLAILLVAIIRVAGILDIHHPAPPESLPRAPRA